MPCWMRCGRWACATSTCPPPRIACGKPCAKAASVPSSNPKSPPRPPPPKAGLRRDRKAKESTMYAFSYERPSSLADAARLTAGGAKPLAGGQTLLASMKLRLTQPDKLADLGGVKELSAIRKE